MDQGSSHVERLLAKHRLAQKSTGLSPSRNDGREGNDVHESNDGRREKLTRNDGRK
jgi:hypothetical protein